MNRGNQTRKRRWTKEISPLIMMMVIPALFVILSACSSIDCPLNNQVYSTYKLAGNVLILEDSLSISTTKVSGVDSVLINLDAHIDSFTVPMSYQGKEDVLYFQIGSPSGYNTIDTVRVQKLDKPHFESVDCNPSFYHTITGVTHTHHRIDSIVINNANVTYNATKCHFYIYFKDNRY